MFDPSDIFDFFGYFDWWRLGLCLFIALVATAALYIRYSGQLPDYVAWLIFWIGFAAGALWEYSAARSARRR